MGFLPVATAFSRRKFLHTLCCGLACALAYTAFSPAYAQEDMFLLKCTGPTPAVKTSSYPGASNIILSNNLAKPTGKAEFAAGQLLTISGRITDENCVPVSNAIVDIWQPNPMGESHWASKSELLNPFPVFAGNGRAVTDNLGNFHFVTLFPGTKGKNAPSINFRVTHPEFSSLDTRMYFRNDARNGNDAQLKKLKEDEKARLLGEIMVDDATQNPPSLKGIYNIVLKGRDAFRHF